MAPGIMNWLFGCRHRDLSRAFTKDHETYKVCLKCGARLRYSWQTMSLVSDKEEKRSQSQSAVRRNQVKGETH